MQTVALSPLNPKPGPLAELVKLVLKTLQMLMPPPQPTPQPTPELSMKLDRAAMQASEKRMRR